MEEQELLVSFLDFELKKIDQAISTANREISLLREYRTRLITDVVTGKLDVREAVAKLPDEVKEPERIYDNDSMEDALEEDFEAVPEEAEA